MNDLHEKNTGRVHPNVPNTIAHLERAIAALKAGEEDQAHTEILLASSCFAPHGRPAQQDTMDDVSGGRGP